MKQLLSLGLLLALLALLLNPVLGRPTENPAKEALQALQEFIGQWKASGGPDKPRPSPSDPIWSESISWNWRFKGDDAWLSMEVRKGKYLKSGEMRYLPEKKAYQLTAVDKEDKKRVFTGTIKNEVLILENVDPETKESRQIQMNSAAEGDRFIYRFAHKNAGSTLFVKDYIVAATREGVSLGKVDKKNECVVSGGLGTIPVSFNGETFYVCCSGCADAFRENPAKYVNEFKAKKNKK